MCLVFVMTMMMMSELVAIHYPFHSLYFYLPSPACMAMLKF